MSKADAIQVGGQHYKQGGKIQHWNMCVLLGFSWEYYIAAATKYATRYMNKNGDQDVEKAIHYTEKLIELVDDGLVPARFRTSQGLRLNLDPQPGPYDRCVDTQALLNEYMEAYDIPHGSPAYEAIFDLFEARDVMDLHRARDNLFRLHDEVLGIVRTPPAEPTVAEIATQKAQAAAASLGAEAGPDYVNQARE